MLGTCAGLVVTYFALRSFFGDGLFVQALLFSTFNIALMVTSPPAWLRKHAGPARAGLLTIGIGLCYAFFLGIAWLAERT